ncbi:hypothetical protein GW933_02615 [Candidatus Falkowbacteria bacterium]|uniref:Thioredoxin-like fold domain-containing protein n=1 Tax=Candidatus Buchananbacteria bacterium CG10_big_fil_rev_8_21_14_0_10_33_19 TaxID=1974525 RepID=A0A2H0W4F6_9BACT|nr:hypothetical protein [Candidatus Falkowbacteria bacterium]PIS06204.1 MAG: hypothetical protein COT80_01370 [Candidatus Buchananbacteria bacterium CG10_big_fil_rev_8_21_14_0_10_33_19]
MLKIFKKNEEDGKKENLIRGLAYGLGGALVIIIVVLLIVFGGKIKDKLTGKSGAEVNNTGTSQDAPKLRITVVTSKNCEGKCFDINLFLDALKQNGIEELGTETINIEDKQGQDLVNKYGIEKVPTVLISGELDKNPQLAQAWSALGEVIDNVFVFRKLIPPYIEVSTGNLRGNFSLVYLTDEACSGCYDVKLHDTALGNLGLATTDAKSVDVSSDEGKDLIKQYNISSAPTILLSGDLSEYTGLQQIWPQVGSISDDGTYVFTKLDEMGSYMNLETGKIIEVQPPTTDETPVQ